MTDTTSETTRRHLQLLRGEVNSLRRDLHNAETRIEDAFNSLEAGVPPGGGSVGVFGDLGLSVERRTTKVHTLVALLLDDPDVTDGHLRAAFGGDF